MDDAEGLNHFIEQYRSEWDQLESGRDERLIIALDDLGRCVL